MIIVFLLVFTGMGLAMAGLALGLFAGKELKGSCGGAAKLAAQGITCEICGATPGESCKNPENEMV